MFFDDFQIFITCAAVPWICNGRYAITGRQRKTGALIHLTYTEGIGFAPDMAWEAAPARQRVEDGLEKSVTGKMEMDKIYK